tara:strand:+ start:21874 stop:22134 length:261 start_codon:yes stop_codon:yes gene_type:complete
MLSNPEDRKKLLNFIKELSDSMTRNSAEKDFQKDVIDRAHDDLNIDKKHIRKLAALYHRQNFTTVQQEQEEVMELYELITSKPDVA